VATRRTITTIIGMSSTALLLLPAGTPATAAQLGVPSATRWYEGRTGTVQWAVGSEFMQLLTDGGATLNVCPAAKVSVDAGSGVSIVSIPVSGNSVIQLNGRENGMDAVSTCAITVTGNGATVELTGLSFTVATAYASSIGASNGDESLDLGTGARKKLPKRATRGTITATSPVIVTSSAFNDLLRAGPVPTMTSDPVNLGLFRLVMKVKAIKETVVENSEG